MAVVKEGPLMKWTNVMKGWQYRWFVLEEAAGLLSYYTSKEKMVRGTRRGCVRLKGAMISIDDDECTFNVTVDEKMFHFQAQDSSEREKWIRALEDVRHRHSELIQKKWDPKVPVPTLDDFNKKLVETDAFLQIMIGQVQEMDNKLDKDEHFACQEHLIIVRDRAKDMLESIKHSIVLLQIAKNVAHPVNGIYQPSVKSKREKGMITRKSRHAAVPADGDDPSASSRLPFDEINFDASIVSGIGVDAGEECFDEEATRTTAAAASVSNVISSATTSTLMTAAPEAMVTSGESVSMLTAPSTSSTNSSLFVPPTSYSSSEDEDFFDANDEDATIAGWEDDSSAGVPGSLGDRDRDVCVLSGLSATEKSDSVSSNLMYKINFDAIYEDDEEEDLGSVANHGSVISHLLSQVKFDMDLTKVVLPTFILERRSLLEMYADFFAHPDIFVSITDRPDPKERMVQMVRWYLSAFHAGRKSSVAKKPYNPILGETFKCYWDVPQLDASNEKVPDGPVPWATKGQLTFIAEQVSHHPPISAFYAEHYDKRITVCAHIWTKSKFLGLSIGVHMIGQGCVTLLDHDEEYILTFPNGYGRSILTIPWVELGGSTTITCAKTGYNANIDFITKPFYGGKKHRIAAEIFQPNDKKPFLTVSGEWNGVMHAKWADGRNEVFVDTTKVPIIKKQVLPVVQQQEFESRMLWCKVTVGLRYRNIQKATEAKFKLEQRQREEAKQRNEDGEEWQTRVFHEIGGNWIYDEPLQKRISSQQDRPNSEKS